MVFSSTIMLIPATLGYLPSGCINLCLYLLLLLLYRVQWQRGRDSLPRSCLLCLCLHLFIRYSAVGSGAASITAGDGLRISVLRILQAQQLFTPSADGQGWQGQLSLAPVWESSGETGLLIQFLDIISPLQHLGH